MVESTALEMRRTGNRIGGSNPSLSANNPIIDKFERLVGARQVSHASGADPRIRQRQVTRAKDSQALPEFSGVLLYVSRVVVAAIEP